MSNSKPYSYVRLLPLSDTTSTDNQSETSPLKEHGSPLYDGELSDNGLTSLHDDTKSTNPFADSAVAERWRKVYEDADYECRHVFEPDLTWSQEEERKVVQKLDWHVCLWAVCKPSCFILYFNERYL